MSSYLTAIEFVLGEAIRFAKMNLSQLENLSFEDALSNLPSPNKRGGHLICGAKAEERLRDLARLAIRRSKYVGRLDYLHVIRELKTEIVRRFITDRRELNSVEADRAIGSAIRRCAKTCITTTHVIPCRISEDKPPESFSIGPAKFTRRDRFFSTFETDLARYAENGKMEKLLRDDTIQYFSSFDWVVEVQLDDCEPAVAEARARQVAQHALDCLHLLIGAGYSGRAKLAGPVSTNVDRRVSIYFLPNGTPCISSSHSSTNNLLGEDWWDYILRDLNYEPIVKLMGTALVGACRFVKQPPMALRFLDAASWYGEAVRDQFPAARVIKYVTAIERILMTKNEEKITETIAERGASLLMRAGYEGIHQKDIREVYDLRSELVHGTASPHQDDWRSLRKVEDVCRKIVISFLPFCGTKGLTDTDVTAATLDSAYQRLVEFIANEMASNTETDARPSDIAS